MADPPTAEYEVPRNDPTSEESLALMALRLEDIARSMVDLVDGLTLALEHWQVQTGPT
jgi:hypothetical protein